MNLSWCHNMYYVEPMLSLQDDTCASEDSDHWGKINQTERTDAQAERNLPIL